MAKAKVEPASAGSRFDQVLATAIALRDKRAALKRKYDELHQAEDMPMKEAYERLQTWLKQQLLTSGTDSMKSAAGTIYFSVTQSASIVDWSAFADYIRKTGEIDLLEHRVSKSSVQEYMKTSEENLPPPGITVQSERNLNIRKK